MGQQLRGVPKNCKFVDFLVKNFNYNTHLTIISNVNKASNFYQQNLHQLNVLKKLKEKLVLPLMTTILRKKLKKVNSEFKKVLIATKNPVQTNSKGKMSSKSKLYGNSVVYDKFFEEKQLQDENAVLKEQNTFLEQKVQQLDQLLQEKHQDLKKT